MEWNEELHDWQISIVDVIELLTGTKNSRRYWSGLKRKMKAEGSQLYEKIVQLTSFRLLNYWLSLFSFYLQRVAFSSILKDNDRNGERTDPRTDEGKGHARASVVEGKIKPEKLYAAKERVLGTLKKMVSCGNLLH